MARNAVISLNNVWKDRSIGLKTKIRILNTLVYTTHVGMAANAGLLKKLMKRDRTHWRYGAKKEP